MVSVYEVVASPLPRTLHPSSPSLPSAATTPLKLGPVSTSTTVESRRHSVASAENPRVARVMVAPSFLLSSPTLLSPLLTLPTWKV